MPLRERYLFGDLALDVAERRLSKNGGTIALAPKAFDVLVHLIRNASRLVTKQELLDEVWAGAFVEEGTLSVHVSGLRKALADTAQSPRYIQTVSRSGYRFVAEVTRSTLDESGASGRYSIAVLPAQPAEDATSDADRSIGLAIADAVIDRLGRYRHLSVRPTRAVHTMTDPGVDRSAVGRALGVDGVVALRFDKPDNRLNVSGDLVRAQDGARVWIGAGIPDAIAESIAAHIGGTASAVHPAGVFGTWAAARRAGLSPPANRPEVYELVGRGRSRLLSFSRSEVPNAIAAYEAAIALDPTFGAAHAGLALACCMRAEFRLSPQADAYAQAREAALRALALDDACADAQMALGAIAFLGQWDWVGAERSLIRALEINPNHTEAYVLYGRLLDALGRLDEGLAMKMRALERDPSSPLVHLAISMSYWNQRRFEDAIAWATRTLELDPRHLVAREHLAGAYWAMGDFDRHMAENIRHAESHGVPAEFLDCLKRVYAAGGRRGVVQWVLDTQTDNLPAFQRALLHGELGNLDEAIRHLEQAIDAHEPCLVEIGVAPQWDPLRADSRFQQCLVRMGLNAQAAGTNF
jgi:DNA-binding winged helix-turn-helix (wHTH) protein/Flp pilus assembly protein TadD